MEIMDERLGHVIKQIPALLFAGRLDTPEPFQPTIAPVAPRSLSHFAIKDDLANCLFRRIVRWWNRMVYKSKVFLFVFL